MGTEWGPGGEPMMGKVKSRSSDASRSEGGSSASKLAVAVNGAAAALEKKKRTPAKFLTKQFEILTKSSSGASPRCNRGVTLLGQDYIIAVPGSRPMSASAGPDPKPDHRSSEPVTQVVVDHKPPIEFVTAPIDYKAKAAQQQRPPLDFIVERSARVAALRTRAYASQSSDSPGRSISGSDRQLSFSRSDRSVLSIPETVIPSDEHGYSRGSEQSASRSTDHSSLAEWSSQSLDRRGELSIAGLSLAEGRRTNLSIGESPDRQTLDYGPDDTDSGIEMYHETTSASPGSYSPRRYSSSLSEDWMPECEDSDGASHHQFRRSRQRGSASSSRRYEFAHMGSSYSKSRQSSRRYHQVEKTSPINKIDELLRKHRDRRRGPVALDALTPEEAIAVFHDEVARMMLEEGHECGEATDVEEFLDGYMRLRSPFYVSMVDEFFRAVCVDCYKRPVDVPHASGSLSSKSLRSDHRPNRRFNSTRM